MARSNKKLEIINRGIGSNIRYCRVAAGLSRGDLATLVGVTHQQFQKYENGTNRISANRLMEVARCLNQPISRFYEGIDDDDQIDTPINQRACLEFMRNFMRISPEHQSAVSGLIKSLIHKNSTEANSSEAL